MWTFLLVSVCLRNIKYVALSSSYRRACSRVSCIQHDSDPHDIHPVDDLIPWQISSLLRCLQMSPENGDFVRNLSFDHYEGLRLLTYTSRLTGLFFGNYRDPVPMSSVLHDWLPPTLPALKALHLEQVPPKFIRALLSVSYVLTSCTIFLSGLYDDGRWSDWILPCEGLKNLIIEMEGVPSEQALLSLVNGCSDSLEYLRLEIIDETMLISNDDEESKWLDGWLPGKFASLESVRLRNISQASCGRIMALAASGLLRATLFPRDRLTKEWLKRLPESLRNVQLITQDFAETASDLVDLLDARPAWLPNLAYIPHIVSDMDEDEPVEGQATWQDAIGQAWMRRRALGI